MALRKNTERPEKILVAMYLLSEGSTKFLDYDDIVVKAFEMFPADFCLRKHPQYPDSSDIHKPLYGPLKRQGLIRAAQKSFALTALGVERAATLIRGAGAALNEKREANRFSHAEEREIERMVKSEAFSLFRQGKSERILDTDFFFFIGCTVRTARNDFLGRLSASKEAIARAKELKQPDAESAKALARAMSFMEERYKNLIDFKGSTHANR